MTVTNMQLLPLYISYGIFNTGAILLLIAFASSTDKKKDPTTLANIGLYTGAAGGVGIIITSFYLLFIVVMKFR